MNNTFPRSRRITKANEFKTIWSKAKRLSGQHLSLVNCQNDLGHPRLGLSFAKKQFPHATDRNRLKRLARETFRLHQQQLPALDIIVVGYKGANLLTAKQQYDLFNSLWIRLAERFNKPQ